MAYVGASTLLFMLQCGTHGHAMCAHCCLHYTFIWFIFWRTISHMLMSIILLTVHVHNRSQTETGAPTLLPNKYVQLNCYTKILLMGD